MYAMHQNFTNMNLHYVKDEEWSTKREDKATICPG